MSRPFSDRLRDVEANPWRWEVVQREEVPSTNSRNRDGLSVQELLRHTGTGEEIVRHTLLAPDGTVFEPPHYRPFWK
jgi:hypothetical protein